MDKEKLKQAVLDSDLYSKSEKLVMNELISISVDFVSVASVKYLINKTKLSQTTTYMALSSLKKRGVIILNNREPNSYTLNQDELARVLNFYKNRGKV
jgi:DNA-binding transcriptional ArsR family regulator